MFLRDLLSLGPQARNKADDSSLENVCGTLAVFYIELEEARNFRNVLDDQ